VYVPLLPLLSQRNRLYLKQTQGCQTYHCLPNPVRSLKENHILTKWMKVLYLRIAQSFTLLRCPRSLPWVLYKVSQIQVVVKALRGFPNIIRILALSKRGLGGYIVKQVTLFIQHGILLNHAGSHLFETQHMLISSPDESLRFPRGPDCILSQLRIGDPSLPTNSRSVCESLSYPSITDLDSNPADCPL
jgi:hypothetical protein